MATRILAALRPDLPPVDAEEYVRPDPPGRFSSDDTPALYTLVAEYVDLRVTIASPTGAVRSTSLFRRIAERVYFSGALTITFDPDERGFVESNGPSVARFQGM